MLKPTLGKLNGIFTSFTRAFLTWDTTRRVGKRLLSGEIDLPRLLVPRAWQRR